MVRIQENRVYYYFRWSFGRLVAVHMSGAATHESDIGGCDTLPDFITASRRYALQLLAKVAQAA